MKISQITTGLQVSSKKNGNGEIVAIITKSTGYVQVQWENGNLTKEMPFNLIGEDGQTLISKPVSETSGMTASQKKHFHNARASKAVAAMSPLDQNKALIISVDNKTKGDRSSNFYQWWSDGMYKVVGEAEKQGNTFIVSVCNTVIKSMNCSEKQAFVIARFATENNIFFF